MRPSTLLAMFVMLASCAPLHHPGLQRSERDNISQERLARELETMAMVTSAASLVRAGKSDVALGLLENRLKSAADSAEEFVAAGVRLPPANPNLQDAPRRAAKYAADNNLEDLAVRMDAVYAKLK